MMHIDFGISYKFKQFRRLCTVLLCLLLSLSVSNAFASKKYRIVVLSRKSKTSTQKQARWFGRSFRKALHKYRKRIVVLDDNRVQKKLIARVIPASQKKKIPVLKKYLAKAKALYATGIPMKTRCKYVLRALKLANQTAEEVKSILEEPNLLRELYLYHALAYFGLSDKANTRKYTLLLAQFAPNFSAAGKSYPAAFVKYFNKIANWVKSKPRLTMNLDTIPRGAIVYHNYRRVGKTPFKLSNLVPAKHSIRLVKPGFQVWERVANLSSKKVGNRRVINAKLPLKRDPNALYLGNIPIYEKDAVYSDDILDLLDKITVRLNADYLYVLEPRKVKKGFLLKVAMYRRGSRKLIHGNLSLGSSARGFRRRIQAFASKVNRLLARK